jgi:hypothetical protein
MGKKAQNSPQQFTCLFCDYTCSKKSHWNQHILTAKHKNANNANKNANKNSPYQQQCEVCGKIYKHKSSLSRHQKICILKVSQSPKVSKSLQKVSSQYFCKCGKIYKSKSGFYKHTKICSLYKNEETQIIPSTSNVEKILTNIMINNKAILEENKELRKEIKKLKTGNTINNNQKLSINVFLNEKCKNAMTLDDFVDNIKLSLTDLEFTNNNGFVEGISKIFIKNLNDMDVTKRPIHCSDQKRLQFYVKKDDKWEKDKQHTELDKSIGSISNRQIGVLQQWIKANPNYMDDANKLEEYFNIVGKTMGVDNEKNVRQIKKIIGENVKLAAGQKQIE